ncbi:MAG: TPR end-of-group domain-containing protein [Pyrinomonadaceae bacterium]
MKLRYIFQLIALLFIAAPAFGLEQNALPKGQVLEKVTCQADAEQSYALYLPSTYTPERKFPVIYAFDPGGRGGRPVELFKAAAEQYGYIVVGSNNSRNGINVNAFVQTLWADTHARFALDERRVYTAGFSGGARVATGLGQNAGGAIAGVIACGGGFPVGVSPSANTPFVLFATTGTEDFNHPELIQLQRAFDALRLPNRLAVFAGAHDWPPPPLALEAIEWFELQAMRAGRRGRDEALIATLLRQRVEAAHAAEAAQKLAAAYDAYDVLVREFTGLSDVMEFQTKLRQLAATKAVKDALKSACAEDEQQLALAEKLAAHPPVGAAGAQGLDDMLVPNYRDTVAQIKRQAQGATDTSERRVARRVLGQFTVSYFETAAALRRQKSYPAAAAQLELLVELRPDNVRALYELATVYALAGQKRPALKTLRRAVAAGLADAALIEQSADLASLRDEAEFKQLVAALKQTAPPAH